MNIPYYFKYKMHILHIFFHWKIEVRLKFEECASFYFIFPKTHIQILEAS
jgi:hypothetical protein